MLEHPLGLQQRDDLSLAAAEVHLIAEDPDLLRCHARDPTPTDQPRHRRRSWPLTTRYANPSYFDQKK